MENSPKGSQGHHILSVEDKRLLDNLLDLLSGPAMGEFQRANRGRTLGLEEPHYCHAISVSLDVAWLRRAVLGILEGSGMGGGWDLEYRNSVALTAYPVPFTQVRLFELRGPKAFGHH